MEFHVRAHSVKVNDEIRTYADEKISGPLGRVLGNNANRIDVEITDLARGRGKPCFRVSIHCFIPHSKTQVVHVEDEDMRAAIDLAADKILRAVKRGRNKRRDKARHSGEWEAPVQAPDGEGDDELEEIAAV